MKVDQGLEPWGGDASTARGETRTKGLDTLAARCEAYRAQGARFAKWRAALRASEAEKLPSTEAVRANAYDLARYAKTCQNAGLVPIVEPEVLINGDYSMAYSKDVATRVLSAVFDALARENVDLRQCLLKPQMVVPGFDHRGDAPSASAIAEATLGVFERCVPASLPGIMFLSGGQSELEATTNLNALNAMAAERGAERAPWALSFSFGRALQASVLEVWCGDASNAPEARAMAAALAAANGAAASGSFQPPHPSLLSGGTLVETFRGWGGAAKPR